MSIQYLTESGSYYNLLKLILSTVKYSSELLPKMHQKLSVAKSEVHLGWVESLLSHPHKQILLRKINTPQKRWTMR